MFHKFRFLTFQMNTHVDWGASYLKTNRIFVSAYSLISILEEIEEKLPHPQQKIIV